MIGFLVKRSTTVFLVAACVLLFGGLTYMELPREANPDVKVPYIIATTPYPGVSPKDIETLESVAYQIDGKTICAFGEACSWPVEAMVAKYREELLADTSEANEAVPHNPEAEAQQRYLQGT